MTRVFSPFWLCAAALALSLGWLLPNHYVPWTSFHADAWVAAWLALWALAALWRLRGPVPWHGLALGVAALLPLPWLQHAVGLLPFAGDAWVHSAYLAGLLLALLTGARWERASPAELGDALFLALGLAALGSVGLQLCQWLNLGELDIWLMGFAPGHRPYANMGQPNQLATLLLWALLGCAWGVLRGWLGGASAALAALFLLVGVALTQSRTAWLALAALLAGAWWWRRLLPRPLPWVASVLVLAFVAFVVALPGLSQALGLDYDLTLALRTQTELRPAAWRLFARAALDSPWWGYGWGQGAAAQMQVALALPALSLGFSQAHNLFLDLVLWNGLPLGLLLSAGLLAWAWQRTRAVASGLDAVRLLLLAVVGLHAMLELPLHYAYFLLPAGLVAGMLDTRLGGAPWRQSPRAVLLGLWLAASLLLAALVRDYLRVEAGFYQLRFEKARIGQPGPAEPPAVWLLTQFSELIRYARLEPQASMADSELASAHQLTQAYPSLGNQLKLAAALGLNQRPAEAQDALRRLCRVLPAEDCVQARMAWGGLQQRQPALARVAWPADAVPAGAP